MSDLLLLTGTLEPSTEVLPALGLLLHSVRVMPPEASALIDAPPGDIVLVDARRDLAHGKSICKLLLTTGLDCPLMIIVTEGGLAAVSADWGADDVVLNTAGPAEVEARLRLALGRRARNAAVDAPDEIRSVALEQLRRAIRLIDHNAHDDELVEYKRFVYSLAETVAAAHKEGGFLGIGGKPISENEQKALDAIAAIFDEPVPVEE